MMNPALRNRILEALAGCDGVTPGPWEYEPTGNGMADMRVFSRLGGEYRHRVVVANVAPQKHDSDAKHLARLDPDFIREVLTQALRVEELEARVKELEGVAGDVAAAYRKHDDPGVSDLYDEQPFPVHLPLGTLRKAARLIPLNPNPTQQETA